MSFPGPSNLRATAASLPDGKCTPSTPASLASAAEIGRKGLREMAQAARVPLLAIGGINTARVGEVIATGCAGIAVMGGVMRAADPASEVKALIATLNGVLATKA